MNVSNILIKTIGMVGLGSVLYDSHIMGKQQSKIDQHVIKTDSVQKTFIDTMSLDTPSKTKDILRKQFLNFKLNETFSTFFTGAAGYAKGFAKMLVNNIIPFSLAMGTVVAAGANKAKGTKGILSKTFGLGLVAYGLVYLLHDVFGIFKPKKL